MFYYNSCYIIVMIIVAFSSQYESHLSLNREILIFILSFFSASAVTIYPHIYYCYCCDDDDDFLVLFRSVDQRCLNILDFPRNILSIDIIEQLKSPEFDVWGWDMNEMLCLCEYMFTVLGITKEFNMDVLNFQTWLVRAK